MFIQRSCSKYNYYNFKTKACIHHQPILHTAEIRYVKSVNPKYDIAEAPLLVDDNEWSYTQLKQSIKNKDIVTAKIYNYKGKIDIVSKDGKEYNVNVPKENIYEIVDDMVKQGVVLKYENKTNDKSIMIPYLLANVFIPFLLFVIIFRIMQQVMRGTGGNMFSFGQSQAKFEEIPETGVCFDDVAGCENAKRDLQEIVDFLKKPDKFTKLGAKIPKGCLLIGPSGTGKTLLAKAVAGEAKVPFFSCSASSWIEMFVGVGSSRVRSLFKDASSKEPCIIFIDETDAVGKTRSSSGGFPGNDEREQTINQLLTEMDGFEGNKGIIVLAATNRPEILDSALTRPGRFDRKIVVERPDCVGRLAILKVHTRNKPLSFCVDLESIARVTAGSSGADLENLANEAAILASRKDKEMIEMEDFDSALDKIVIGEERITSVMSEKQKQIVSVHEAGHTLVSLLIGEYDKLKKVTIIPRGLTGGVTVFEPNEERVDFSLYSKEYLQNQICVALGGRVAEEIVFGGERITTGASSDLTQVMNIARRMVTDFGFTQKLGPVAWKSGSYLSEEGKGYSEQTAYIIDEEVKYIVNRAYKKTHDLLKNNEKKLILLSNSLKEMETMSGAEVKELLKIAG